MLGIGLYLWFNKDNYTKVYKSKNEETKENVVGSNWLSMMYETGPGTGEYTESKSSLWPESGYIFNDTLSSCENGSKLSWNDELKAVTLHSNKSDSCYVYFDVYIIPVINSVITSYIETDSITLTVNVTNGNNPVTTYYYSNNNGNSYETSNSNTYTFSGLDMGTVYNFSVYVEDSAGYTSEVYNLNETTDDTPPTLADVCSNGDNLATCIKNYHSTTGDVDNGIYYHTSSLANSAADNSYRYAGANPNNYVCFGSDAATCPSDNLYRIIGVFGSEVKLIKADYPTTSQTGTGGAYNDTYESWLGNSSYYKGNQSLSSVGTYYWKPNGNNTWSSSSLVTTNLNNNFLKSFSSTWQNKIATHTWYVGGHSTWDSTPKEFYNAESSGTTWSGKIGLMYISDYGYAATNTYWTYPVYSLLDDGDDGYDYRAATDYNWMYMGLYEWTISRDSSSSDFAYLVVNTGYVGPVSVETSFVIRPCFYLNSGVLYSSGTGTESDPIRLAD